MSPPCFILLSLNFHIYFLIPLSLIFFFLIFHSTFLLWSLHLFKSLSTSSPYSLYYSLHFSLPISSVCFLPLFAHSSFFCLFYSILSCCTHSTLLPIISLYWLSSICLSLFYYILSSIPIHIGIKQTTKHNGNSFMSMRSQMKLWKHDYILFPPSFRRLPISFCFFTFMLNKHDNNLLK